MVLTVVFALKALTVALVLVAVANHGRRRRGEPPIWAGRGPVWAGGLATAALALAVAAVLATA